MNRKAPPFSHRSKYFKSTPTYINQRSFDNEGKRIPSKINLYSVFLEQCFNLLSQCRVARAGLVKISLALRRREIAKWVSLPCFFIWLALMILIWLFLLGVANVISGHFTPLEVILTVVVGIALGIVMWRKGQADADY